MLLDEFFYYSSAISVSIPVNDLSRRHLFTVRLTSKQQANKHLKQNISPASLLHYLDR
jgi:hypothetical protein